MESSELRTAIANESGVEAVATSVVRKTPCVEAASQPADDAQGVPPLSVAWSVSYLAGNLRTALPLAMSDQLVLSASLVLALWTVRTTTTDAQLLRGQHPYLACGLLLSFTLARLYPGIGLSMVAELRRTTLWITGLFAAFLCASLTYGASLATQALLVVTAVGCLQGIPLARHLTRRICGRFSWWAQPILVFDSGDGDATDSILSRLAANPQLGLRPIDAYHKLAPSRQARGDGFGTRHDLPARSALAPWARQRAIYRALVSLPDGPESDRDHLIESTTDCFPQVWVVSRIRNQGLPLVRSCNWEFDQHAGFELRNRLRSPTAYLVKRTTDLLLATLGGIVLLPVMLTIAVAIRLTSPGPVLYGQERIGRGGVRFRTWKFRTMLGDAEEILEDFLETHPELRAEWERECKLSKDPRVIPGIGQFLRKSSLDELPQLWNVIRGQMSFVGPRPLPEYHLAQFDTWFCRYREKVTPGITGLWQVTSRGNGHPEMYVDCDCYYIRHWSLWLDLKILVRTFQAVLSGRGAT